MSCVLNKHCLLGLRVGLGDLKYTEDDWHTLHPVPIIITTYVLVIPAKMVSFQVPEHLFLTAARLPENAWHDLFRGWQERALFSEIIPSHHHSPPPQSTELRPDDNTVVGHSDDKKPRITR